MDKKQILQYIHNTLEKNSLSSEVDLNGLVNQKVEELENNIRFVCESENGKRYIAKFSIMSLGHKPEHSGIRAKMNLANEVRFYRQIADKNFQHVKIPDFLVGEDSKNAYLIIEYLDSDETYIFEPADGFNLKGYPDFFAESVVKGLREFHSKASNVDNDNMFPVMQIGNIRQWLSDVGESLPEDLATEFSTVEEIFDENSKLLRSRPRSITHSDILPDTLGYEKESKRLVLLDFEKAQLSIKEFDYSAFIKSSAHQDWVRESFEPVLYSYFSDRSFKISYIIFKLLRLVTSLANFESGRLDHVFIAMLGKDRFEELRKPSIKAWKQELRRSLEEIKA